MMKARRREERRGLHSGPTLWAKERARGLTSMQWEVIGASAGGVEAGEQELENQFVPRFSGHED